jgi:hypothetical protein
VLKARAEVFFFPFFTSDATPRQYAATQRPIIGCTLLRIP